MAQAPGGGGSGFNFGFPILTSAETKSHSASASPNKKQKNVKGSPGKGGRHSGTRGGDVDVSTQNQSQDDGTTANSVQFSSESVSKLLDNEHLNAASANAFHDLQCSTGVLVLQAFLEHPRLRRALGCEQNKELFHLAQQNASHLAKNGYQGRKFFVVENIPGVKIIIGEYASEEVEASKSFSKGEIVTCLHGLKRNSIDKREDYRGVINSIKKDGTLYDITMSATKKVIQNVKKEYIFKLGSERTLEFARCNLFQRKDGFRCDIVLLPFYIANDSYKSLLFGALSNLPYNGRILAYESLEEWDRFPQLSFRRVDCNVYENDRFNLLNVSPFFKVYLYKHIIGNNIATPLAKLNKLGSLKIGNYVNVRDNELQKWITSKIININEKNNSIIVERFQWEVPFEEEVKLDSQRIHLIEFEYAIGDIVHCYCTRQVEDNKNNNKWNLFRCSVLRHNEDGTYVIEFEDGEIYRRQESVWMFRPPKFVYEEGDMLMAQRYDLISPDVNSNFDAKMVPPQHPCIVRHRNANGTYRVEFLYEKLNYHDLFNEKWLRPLTANEREMVDPILPIAFELDYDTVDHWRCNMTCQWLRRCGFDEETCKIFLRNNINGVFLLNLTLDILVNDLGISKNIANDIYKYIRSLRREIQFYHEDDSKIIDEIREKLTVLVKQRTTYQHMQEQAMHKLTDLTNKQNQKNSQNNNNNNNTNENNNSNNNNNQENDKAQKDYELKIKCIEMSKKGQSKKAISTKLKKPMNWVNKYYGKNANTISKPKSSNSEVEDAKESLRRITSNLRDIDAQINSERHRLRLYNYPRLR